MRVIVDRAAVSIRGADPGGLGNSFAGGAQAGATAARAYLAETARAGMPRAALHARAAAAAACRACCPVCMATWPVPLVAHAGHGQLQGAAGWGKPTPRNQHA